MFVVVAYDVVDDKNRTRLAKVLQDYGTRVQKSVFEADVDEKSFMKMKAAVEKHLNMDTDSVRYYFLCQRCIPGIVVSGWGRVPSEDDDVVIV